MAHQFRTYLDDFLEAWYTSNLSELSEFLCKDYQAREIAENQIIDFGYEQSIQGWEEGFRFVKENNHQWLLEEVSITPLRHDEQLVVISATIIVQGKPLDTANLFFNTFKKVEKNDWKLVRSYIETGIPLEFLKFDRS